MDSPTYSAELIAKGQAVNWQTSSATVAKGLAVDSAATEARDQAATNAAGAAQQPPNVLTRGISLRTPSQTDMFFKTRSVSQADALIGARTDSHADAFLRAMAPAVSFLQVPQYMQPTANTTAFRTTRMLYSGLWLLESRFSKYCNTCNQLQIPLRFKMKLPLTLF
ncbi:unnamed protein product [Calypogeia fissa]